MINLPLQYRNLAFRTQIATYLTLCTGSHHAERIGITTPIVGKIKHPHFADPGAFGSVSQTQQDENTQYPA